MDFPCVKCGLCCRMLDLIPDLSDYDDGNGVCRYLVGTLCGIYDARPLICNVEAMYTWFFKETMTENDFITLNLKSCQKIAEKFQDSSTLQKIKAASTKWGIDQL